MQAIWSSHFQNFGIPDALKSTTIIPNFDFFSKLISKDKKNKTPAYHADFSVKKVFWGKMDCLEFFTSSHTKKNQKNESSNLPGSRSWQL